jgi:hypothetical protein
MSSRVTGKNKPARVSSRPMSPTKVCTEDWTYDGVGRREVLVMRHEPQPLENRISSC